MNYYIECLKKYADFNGRARRSEYWYFVLFNLLISFCLGFVGGFISGLTGAGENLAMGVAYLYALATLLPSIAVGVRRLHDIGMSGWWILLGLVPIAGIVLLVFFCKDGQPGENQYGPNPKEGLALSS